MKICVIGNGNIGSRLIRLGCEPISLNLLDKKSVDDGLSAHKPDLVIHAAGVSSPESCEKEPELARAVNVHGTALLCEAAEDNGSRVLLLSTDHVFDGKQGDYLETDDPLPVNEYGRTKLAAEGLVQLYGGKMLRLSRGFDKESADLKAYELALKTGGNIYVPDFIVRSYTHFDHLAEAILFSANQYDKLPEILHVASLYSMSFYDFILKVGLAKGWNLNAILPRKSEDDGFSPRPLRCGLNTSLARSLGVPTPSTQESIGLL